MDVGIYFSTLFYIARWDLHCEIFTSFPGNNSRKLMKTIRHIQRADVDEFELLDVGPNKILDRGDVNVV